MGIFQDYCGNFLHIFLGNIPTKLGIFLNISGILPKNWEFYKIIVEISSTYFVGGIPQKLGISQNIWGIFSKNWEFSKSIVEISSTCFRGIFPKNWKFPEIFGEYFLKIGNFQKLLWNFPNIFWEIFYINLGNFPNIFKKISSTI